jgi:uncharacterized protein with NRDE domain
MCLLVLAWKTHPRYRLVFAGNRDEFHARPAAPMAWWNEAPDILAGRDLQAGGTWLGLSRDARFAVVTNFRDLQPPLPGAPSRGTLVTRWLEDERPAMRFAESLSDEAPRYSGFNLLLADDDTLIYASNRAPAWARSLNAGVHGLSNHLLDTPWPKLERTRERFRILLERHADRDDGFVDDLIEMLADRTLADETRLPTTGLSRDWELLLSAPFIVDPRYGTRCSTVVLIGHDGRVIARERRFDASGRSTGMEEFEYARPA